jgi:DNA-binding HxlR family transcriptional regulator
METIETAMAALDPCDVLDEGEERLAKSILDHIADKWSIWVIYALGRRGRLRFSRLLEQVEGVSQKMLTKTLRRLERDGLVSRTMYLEVPPRVEYELSPAGAGTAPAGAPALDVGRRKRRGIPGRPPAI